LKGISFEKFGMPDLDCFGACILFKRKPLPFQRKFSFYRNENGNEEEVLSLKFCCFDDV